MCVWGAVEASRVSISNGSHCNDSTEVVIDTGSLLLALLKALRHLGRPIGTCRFQWWSYLWLKVPGSPSFSLYALDLGPL